VGEVKLFKSMPKFSKKALEGQAIRSPRGPGRCSEREGNKAFTGESRTGEPRKRFCSHRIQCEEEVDSLKGGKGVWCLVHETLVALEELSRTSGGGRKKAAQKGGEQSTPLEWRGSR